jgi:hypothetical protein
MWEAVASAVPAPSWMSGGVLDVGTAEALEAKIQADVPSLRHPSTRESPHVGALTESKFYSGKTGFSLLRANRAPETMSS